MSKNIKIFLLVLVTMLSLAGSASAVEHVYTHSSGTGNWTDAATWVTTESVLVPAWNGDYSNPISAIVDGGVVNVTGSGQQGTGRCFIRSGATVNVSGTGVDRDFIVGLNLTLGDVTGDSTLNITGSGTIVYCEQLQLGAVAGGSGTINIGNGATLMHGGWGTSVGMAGTGTINMTGTGSIFLWDGNNGKIVMNGTGHINIEAGKIEQNGDLVTLYQSYVDNGWITGYGGVGVVDVALVGGWTIVTASVPISLDHGIVIDRQFHTIPAESYCLIADSDITLIKSMGFKFVKLLINPDLMISGNTINTANMWYVDEIVNRVVNQGLSVVVCIHPENSFKQTYLGNGGANFPALLGFYRDFAGYLAARWGSNQLAFQLMTEPFGNSPGSWNTMLPQMVQAVRDTMPDHTLILSGDQVGTIAGLLNVNPDLINDDNVIYGFSYWDEGNVLPFVFQGAGFSAAYMPYLKNVPYPSNETMNAADYILPSCPSGQYSAALAAVNAYCDENWNMTKQRSILQSINTWNQSHGGNLKVMCYEMGTPLDLRQGEWIAGGGVDPLQRIQYINDKRIALEENNIDWAYWSYNGTFTVLNPNLRRALNSPPLPNADTVSAATLRALGMKDAAAAQRSWVLYDDADFEFNPSGAWSHGVLAAPEYYDDPEYLPDTTTFELYGKVYSYNESIFKWGLSRLTWDMPGLTKHTIAADLHGGAVAYEGIPRGWMSMHPGLALSEPDTSEDHPVMSRWTSPISSSGIVYVSGVFAAGDSGKVDCFIFRNGTEVKLDVRGATSDVPFNFTLSTLNIGDTIDFVVTQSFDGSSGDTTPVIARIDLRTCADLETQGQYQAFDFNHDCYIDIADLAEFVKDWLKCDDPANAQCTGM